MRDEAGAVRDGQQGVKEHPQASVTALLGAALVWSWAWWAGAIAAGGVESPAGGLLWIAGGLGPAVVVGVTLWRSPAAYRASLRRRLFRWRFAWPWWAATVAVSAGPKPVAMVLGAAAGHVPAGEAIALTAIPVSLMFMLIVVLIEEPLWRGVALDAYRGTVRKASLAIGVVWSLWHVPLFLVPGTWQHGLGFATADFWIFCTAVVGLSVPLTWLVVRTGSILPAMLGHLLLNMAGEMLPDDTTIRFLEMCVVWGIAAVVLTRMRERRAVDA